MTIKHVETLTYYDGVLEFKAISSDDEDYICVLVDMDSNAYLCVYVSESTLRAYSAERVNLCSLYQDSKEFYSVQNDDLYTDMEAKLIKRDDVPADWFPWPDMSSIEVDVKEGK